MRGVDFRVKSQAVRLGVMIHVFGGASGLLLA
jgi:hypothetical protein